MRDYFVFFHMILMLVLTSCEHIITEYACEGEQIKLNCENGSIFIKRANYGRLSISMCNLQGFTNISTHCVLSSTRQTIQQM